MTYDSKNYSGPGAVGAISVAGRNAVGQPVTPGPNVPGADSLPIQTLPGHVITAGLVQLEANPSAAVGVTSFSDSSNGTLTLSSDYIIAYAKLDARGVVVIEPQHIVLP